MVDSGDRLVALLGNELHDMKLQCVDPTPCAVVLARAIRKNFLIGHRDGLFCLLHDEDDLPVTNEEAEALNRGEEPCMLAVRVTRQAAEEIEKT